MLKAIGAEEGENKEYSEEGGENKDKEERKRAQK